ncbi:TadE/TadG family type IV pilus assembly protein [Isoptericola sp. NPDC056573]|uniref:TadE/TadG family type IV pilus assembly protein n=1 Tax=unclassified Isoptericola TaxID=2623355 RepID=UPI003685BA0D
MQGPRGPRARGARERGSSTIEMVFLLPALFTLMFAGIQAGLWYQARTVAYAAAQEGVRAAAAENGTAGAGEAAASDYLADVGGGLTGRGITVRPEPTEVTVTVRVSAQSIVPLWNPEISQSASLPVERLTG